MLTPKQTRFVERYLVSLNGAQAATEAGYSARTARHQASQLLDKPQVQAALQAAMAARSKEAKIEQADVLRELAQIAFVDIGEAFGESGELLPLSGAVRMPEKLRRAIAGLDVEELFEGKGEEREQVGRVKKLKLADKLRALELLGKHLGMFKESLKVEAGDSLIDLVLKASRPKA